MGGELQLNLQSHVDSLVKLVVPKVRNSGAKKPQKKFLEDLLAGLQGGLTVPELEQLQKNMKEFVKKKKVKVAEELKQQALVEAKAEEEAKKKTLGEQDVADADYFDQFG